MDINGFTKLSLDKFLRISLNNFLTYCLILLRNSAEILTGVTKQITETYLYASENMLNENPVNRFWKTNS